MSINKTTKYTTDPNTIPVDTSTGAQEIAVALDERVNRGSIGVEIVSPVTGADSLVSVLNNRGYLLSTTVEVTVGTGGDYETLNDAVTFASKFTPVYTKATGEVQNKVNIRILSGTTITEGLDVRQVNLSHVRIISDDAVVPVNYVPGGTGWFIYGSYNTVLPTIATVFDLQGIGYDGLSVKWNSSVYFEAGAGIINAANDNILLNTNSNASLRDGVFTGAGDNGVKAEKGSRFNARDADFSGAAGKAIFLLNDSHCSAFNANCSSAGTNAIELSLGSTCVAYGADLSNCGGSAIYVVGGSSLSAPDCIANNVGAAAWFRALDGSSLNLDGASGSGGDTVILLQSGSRANVQNIDGSGVAGTAFRVLEGSILNAFGTTGSLSQTENTISNNGIIFR